MQVTPPSQAPKPAQGAPQVPGGQPKPGGAEQAIQMIQAGFKQLAQMIQAAQGKIDPNDVKLFQAALQATDNFIQAIMNEPDQGQAEPAKSPGGPMPANANAQARPSNY